MKRAPMTATAPIERELLLIGGGHSHVAVIRHFAMNPVPGVRVSVISRDVHTPYSGMLPGLVAGHYRFDECHIDLRPLCEAAGVRLIHATVSGIDRAGRQVLCEGRAPLSYDWLSINIGSRPALHTIEGAEEHGIAVKPINRFLENWQQLIERLGADPQALRIAVVGGGAAGVEVALACKHSLRSTLGDAAARVQLTLVCAAPQLLETHNTRVRRYFSAKLQAEDITVHCGQRVVRADSAGLVLEDETRIDTGHIVWAVHAGSAPWPRESGLQCDADGFIEVLPSLLSRNDPRIFAAGDIAALPRAVAKSGVYAVRAGQVLAHNLERALRGQTLRAYRPQRRFLALLSTGDRHAVVSRGPMFASGRWVWRWKDRIDRRFMERYRVAPLPPASPDELTGMRCGGCAAKVGSTSLQRVLAQLNPAVDGAVSHGVASAEDAAVLEPPRGRQLVQSVDYFRAFVDDPYLLGRIAALHALGDLYAMGAEPHSALAIATVPFAAAPVMERTLEQLMHGALCTLEAENVRLVGGHSNEGSELAFGLSVNGFAQPQELLLKSALRPGHALILSKAIGSGTLLAANMHAAAQGRWIDAAIENMLLSPRAAVAVLRAHEVAACTDITGYGLLGHLLEMLRASAVGVHLRPDAIPLLAGARECLERGYRSSLHESNRSHLAALEVAGTPTSTLELLLDPQTAGGLLAAVPAERAESCVAALRAAGYADAALIAACDPLLTPGQIALC